MALADSIGERTDAVDIDAIPAELRQRSHWVCWRYERSPGSKKPKKVPYVPQAGNRQKASPTDPNTWRDFETALQHINRFDGIGIMFADGLMGVDLDDCRDPATGAIHEAAQAIIDRVDSYTEVSPSESGVKTFCLGAVPAGRQNKTMPWGGALEVYSEAHYFTVTAQHLAGTPTEVGERQAEVDALYAELFPPGPKKPSGRPVRSRGSGLDDDELVQRAMVSDHGSEFIRLWNGDIGGFPSQSEADLKLCAFLAFWTNGDEARVDRLFRRSSLFRPKWDEVHYSDGSTYGAETVRTAVAGQRTFYIPSENRVAYGDGFLRTHRNTLLFDKGLRALKNPAHRALFLQLLLLAWPMRRWGYIGCLRDEGKGPYTVRALADLLGWSRSFVHTALTAMHEKRLLERTDIRGETYWHIVEYEKWIENGRELLSATRTSPLAGGDSQPSDAIVPETPKLQDQVGAS